MALELQILSMANEATDEERRSKLNSLFSEKMALPRQEAVQFAKLFDSTIVRMGGEIQEQARRKAMQMQHDQEEKRQQKEKKENDSVSDGNDVTDSTDSTDATDAADAAPREKTSEERKLWAFVDMMVQSKSLAKKTLG